MAIVGIFGDIHSNAAALEAVLAALEAAECERFVCTGDVVGYGPCPAECIRILRQREIPCVLGNHDKFATTLVSRRLERLKPDTRRAIEWTRKMPTISCVALHPGTVATELSSPFTRNARHAVFSPDEAARHLLNVIDGLGPDQNGRFYAWDGKEIPW